MVRHDFVLRGVTVVVAVAAVFVAEDVAWAQDEAKDDTREEYVSTGSTTPLLRDDLAVVEGKEAHVMQVEFAPGWVGERHYHTGDVFVYVVEGEFVVDVEGQGRLTYSPGEAFHEAVNTVMQARNPSQTEPLRILLFQVGEKGQPLMIKAE